MNTRINLKEIFSKPPLELCDECKKCEFNKNPQNKHKPCNYQYCNRKKKFISEMTLNE